MKIVLMYSVVRPRNLQYGVCCPWHSAARLTSYAKWRSSAVIPGHSERV
jgi:hypothetical protein